MKFIGNTVKRLLTMLVLFTFFVPVSSVSFPTEVPYVQVELLRDLGIVQDSLTRYGIEDNIILSPSVKVFYQSEKYRNGYEFVFKKSNGEDIDIDMIAPIGGIVEQLLHDNLHRRGVWDIRNKKLCIKWTLVTRAAFLRGVGQTHCHRLYVEPRTSVSGLPNHKVFRSNKGIIFATVPKY